MWKKKYTVHCELIAIIVDYKRVIHTIQVPLTFKRRQISHISSFTLSLDNLQILSNLENTLSAEQLLDSWARKTRQTASPWRGDLSLLGFHHFQMRWAYYSPASCFHSKTVSWGSFLRLILPCIIVLYLCVEGIISRSWSLLASLTTPHISFFNLAMKVSLKWL